MKKQRKSVGHFSLNVELSHAVSLYRWHISVTKDSRNCATFTKSSYDMNKLPIFVQVHLSHDVASTHRDKRLSDNTITTNATQDSVMGKKFSYFSL